MDLAIPLSRSEEHDIPSIIFFVSTLIAHHSDAYALNRISSQDVSPVAHSPLSAQNGGANSFRISSWISAGDKQRYYKLECKEHNRLHEPHWSLILTDPVGVMQCLRADLKGSTVSAARLLFSYGVSFSTVLPLAYTGGLSLDLSTHTAKSLGWRGKAKPTKLDYPSYQSILSQSLSRPEIQRAAVLQGGIIWRLALGHSNCYPVDLEQLIVEGPSEHAKSQSHRITAGRDAEGCDDILIEEEKDLICGVHKWPTGA